MNSYEEYKRDAAIDEKIQRAAANVGCSGIIHTLVIWVALVLAVLALRAVCHRLGLTLWEAVAEGWKLLVTE